MNKKKYFKKMASYFFKQKKLVIIYIITSIIAVIINTVMPSYSAKLLTAITNIELSDVLIISAIILGLDIFSDFINIFNRNSSNKLQDQVSIDIKADVSEELFALETKNFDTEGTGFFSSRIESEPRNLAWVFSSIRYYFLDVFSSLGIYIYMFIICWQIAVFITIISLLLFFIRRIEIKGWEERRKGINNLHEKYTGTFSEIIRGIRDIKVLNLKRVLINKVLNEQKQITIEEYKLSKRGDKYSTLYSIANSLSNFSILVLGVYLIKGNVLSGASLIVIYMYSGRAFGFFNNISSAYKEIKEFNLSFERLFEVIDGYKYPKEKWGNKKLKRISGNIEFRNVNFSYDKENKVLKKCSFKIMPNETIGIVGKSGQGKTTIINLISKLYSTDNNSIFIDNIDINDLTENTIRNNISVITQDPYIFNMTIRENLKIVKPNLTEKEMIKKCKQCALHDFIKTLPNGYDTVVGENGVILSGGQKQRLAIARALIKDSEIILLDEATSSLDNETQDYIQESIKKISKDYTILIIAHRLSTVKNCDRILIVDNGTIAGDGSHQELVKTNKTYGRLYKKELQ